MRVLDEVDSFMERWVYMNTCQYSPILEAPEMPAVPSSGWGHVELTDAMLDPVMAKIKVLQDSMLTTGMVVKEFVRKSIGPL
ncbi:hypothetical protein D1007_30953 [Hordeum vulgare]|nr:hypothetical protein D1007_30953 [Hordeum vulgare]